MRGAIPVVQKKQNHKRHQKIYSPIHDQFNTTPITSPVPRPMEHRCRQIQFFISKISPPYLLYGTVSSKITLMILYQNFQGYLNIWLINNSVPNNCMMDSLVNCKDHLIQALWSSWNLKTKKTIQKGDFAGHCPNYIFPLILVCIY